MEALKESRTTCVNKNTSPRIHGLLCKRVVELAHAEAAPFAGYVEVDKSYFGPRRVRDFRGRGVANNTPVVGLLKRGGRVICSPLPKCSKSELLQMIKGHVYPASESTIFTDGWRGYDGFLKATNTTESTIAKMNLPGDSDKSTASNRFGVTPKPDWRGCAAFALMHFSSHLKETERRFNRRRDKLYKCLI